MSSLFGDKLRFLRSLRGMTQAELAAALNLTSQAYVSNLEAGNKAPSLDLVIRVARLFEASVEYLLRDVLPLEAQGRAGNEGGGTMLSTDNFGRQLRELRLQRGMSQTALAQALGLTSRASLSNLEAGRKAPSLGLVVRVGDVFGVRLDALFERGRRTEDGTSM